MPHPFGYAHGRPLPALFAGYVGSRYSTVTFTAAEVDVVSLASPEYLAVTPYVPAAMPWLLAVRVATPLMRLAVPRLSVPDEKVTEPPGVPLALVRFTVACN